MIIIAFLISILIFMTICNIVSECEDNTTLKKELILKKSELRGEKISSKIKDLEIEMLFCLLRTQDKLNKAINEQNK